VSLKGLEILLKVTFAIESSKVKILERLQDHIKLHYTVQNPDVIASSSLVEEDAEIMIEEPGETSEEVIDIE
jgi:hypothetical protein